MNELTKPATLVVPAKCDCDFAKTDLEIDELEKRYKNLLATDENKKDIKSICAELNKVKKALSDAGIKTEKEATTEIKAFRAELKKRTDRIESIRTPLWEQVKPQSKPEPKKVSVPVKVCYLFEGDSNYISEMIAAAEFNGIKVTEVELNG